MEQFPFSLSPTVFMERVVNNNQPLLSALEKDSDFNQAYNSIEQNNKLMTSLNQDLMAMLFKDEYVPGEQSDDEFAYIDSIFQRPVSSRMLRAAGKTEPARLIKNTRILQLREFGKPSFEDNQPGVYFCAATPGYHFTKEEKARIDHFLPIFIDKFFYPAFAKRPNFGEWLGVAYCDFFDLDDITNEVRRRADNIPLGFQIVDPTLIKTVIPKNPSTLDRWDVVDDKRTYQQIDGMSTLFRSNELKQKKSEIEYLLVKNGVRLGAYSGDRMVKSHFFTSSNYLDAYRGFSIVEQGIRMLLNIMNTITYNASNFNNNRTPQGVFVMEGAFTNRMMTEQFKKVLYAYLSGANNRHRLPVLGLPDNGDAKFIPFSMGSKEMEFHLWVTLLFSILCQLSGTNPEEISMSSHESAMTGKKLFDQSPDGVLQISRDKGLNNFLYYIEDIINKSNVLKEITGLNICMKFRGLQAKDIKADNDNINSRLTVSASLNDIIKERGGNEEFLPYGDYNIYDIKGINNPNIFAALQEQLSEKKAVQQMRQQEIQNQTDALNNTDGQQQDITDDELKQKYGYAQ